MAKALNCSTFFLLSLLKPTLPVALRTGLELLPTASLPVSLSFQRYSAFSSAVKVICASYRTSLQTCSGENNSLLRAPAKDKHYKLSTFPSRLFFSIFKVGRFLADAYPFLIHQILRIPKWDFFGG